MEIFRRYKDTSRYKFKCILFKFNSFRPLAARLREDTEQRCIMSSKSGSNPLDTKIQKIPIIYRDKLYLVGWGA